MPQTAAQTKPQSPQSKGWTPQRRARHAAAIKIWAPWAKSTGPRTQAGKKVSRINALKHGNRDYTTRFVRAALARHGRYLRGIDVYLRLKKKNLANELLKKLLTYLQKESLQVTILLVLALEMVKADGFSHPPPANDG